MSLFIEVSELFIMQTFIFLTQQLFESQFRCILYNTILHLQSAPVTSSQPSQELKKSNLKSHNGEVDYKKVNNPFLLRIFLLTFLLQLWEASQSENSKLRTEMSSIRTDLDSTRHQLEAAIQVTAEILNMNAK